MGRDILQSRDCTVFMPFLIFQRLLGAALIALSGVVLASETPVAAHEPVPVSVWVGGTLVELSAPDTVTTVGQALALHGIPTEKTFISPPADTPLSANLVVTLTPTRVFFLTDGADDPVPIETIGRTVGDALIVERRALGPMDSVTPEPAAALTDGMRVIITRVHETERTETVAVPHRTVFVDDPTMLWASEVTISGGADGSAEEDVRLRYVNGELTKRTVLAHRVLAEPVTAERRRGTKIVVEETAEGGASWYAYKDCDCGAHNRYPRGTWLRVTNLLDGSRVMIKTNDWGPDPAVHPERVVDLDAVAFRKLAPLWKGVIPVRVEKVKTE
jgi:uncharacterized protein YabE (DUF348 family)